MTKEETLRGHEFTKSILTPKFLEGIDSEVLIDHVRERSFEYAKLKLGDVHYGSTDLDNLYDIIELLKYEILRRLEITLK